MLATTLIATAMLIWLLVAMLIDARRRRHRRPELTTRLRPFQPPSLADEAQAWLDRYHGRA